MSLWKTAGSPMPRIPDETLARSFGAAVSQYASARPDYPADAIDWLLPPGARRVLDLGAGTGKLTAQLAARGLEVAAVEPSDEMRRALGDALPSVCALAGSAEAIPVPDGSSLTVRGCLISSPRAAT